MRMRKGFTLLEIMIIIVTMSILIASMMLSARELSTSAEATNIFNNMVNIKIAALAWSKEHADMLVDGGAYIQTTGGEKFIQAANKNDALGIGKYLDTGGKIIINEGTQDGLKAGTYGIYNVDKGTTVNGGDQNLKTWYVGYKFTADEESVKEKLKAQAKSMGLHFTARWPENFTIPGGYKGDDIVWLKVLGEWNPPEGFISSR